MLINLRKLSNYTDLLKLEHSVAISDEHGSIFVKTTLDGFGDFEGKELHSIKDFLNKMALFTVVTPDKLPTLEFETVVNEESHLKIKNNERSMVYTFSTDETDNHLTKNKNGDDITVMSAVDTLEKNVFSGAKKTTVSLSSERFKELKKLNDMFHSYEGEYQFTIKDGNVSFIKTTGTGNEIKEKISESSEAFEENTHTLNWFPHVDSWDITFYENIRLVKWESTETDFIIIMNTVLDE